MKIKVREVILGDIFRVLVICRYLLDESKNEFSFGVFIILISKEFFVVIIIYWFIFFGFYIWN